MADFDYIPINATAEKIEKIANMDINNEILDKNSNDDSLPTSKLVYDTIKNLGGGGGENINVDQTYNPESQNAQSGVAIHGLIGDLPEEDYNGETPENVIDYIQRNYNYLSENNTNLQGELYALTDRDIPQMRGAEANGITDDTNAILSTIAYNENGTVYFPKGTYKVTSDIVLDKSISLIGADEAILVLENESCITINASDCKLENLIIKCDTNYTSILTINAENISVIGCEFDGLCEMTDHTGDSSGNNAINLCTHNITIQDCYIHNIKGGLIEGWHNRLKPMISLTNITIENNKLHDSDTGDIIALCASDSRIVGNTVYGKWQNCMLIHADTGSNCERVVFERNTIDVDLARQYTQAGYGIALRRSDDNLYGCINCKVINNNFIGWGNTKNGSQGVYVDQNCHSNYVDGNSFRGNIPDNGSCIANYAINTIISNNTIAIESGTKITGINLLLGNATVVGNIVTNSTENSCISVSGNSEGNHLICDNVINGALGITAVKNDIVKGNKVSATERAITLSQQAKAIGNHIKSTKNGIYMGSNCDGSNVSDNHIIINGGIYGIQCQGANNVIKNNYVVGGSNAAIAGISNTGIITIDGNTVVNSVIQVSSAGATYWVTNNDCGNKTLAVANVALTIFAYNNRNYTFMSNVAIAKRVENGIAKQAAPPISEDAANVWGNSSMRDIIKRYNIVVEDTSVTPYQRYVLRSDNTWQSVYN